jgi:5-enolpyruvylshikimate-3-phosphate synthase
LPVYVGVEEGYVYVKRTAPMDKRQFRKYVETCRRLGFRFDRRGERWVKPLEEPTSEETSLTPQAERPSAQSTRLLFMDRLAEAIAEYLCRYRSVGLLRLTLDLTRQRLDIFAEVGAVEVVKGAVSPPAPGTEAWWAAVAAVREAVFALRERGLAQYVREAEVVSWTGPSC